MGLEIFCYQALILQESEKHIKDLEAAVNHLLEVESESFLHSVFWEDYHLGPPL